MDLTQATTKELADELTKRGETTTHFDILPNNEINTNMHIKGPARILVVRE
jgi:hypothetical protein